MVPIGRWVLDEGLRQARRWSAWGLGTVSLNISAEQLRANDFGDQVTAALAIHDIDASSIILEIGETDFATAVETDPAVLLELRQRGVRIAVDDFGAGICSLAHLQRCPVDLVKIDKQFIGPLGDVAEGSSFVRMILGAVTEHGAVVVAEGIERSTQLAELRRLGCALGQGFLLSPPLEAADLSARLGIVDAPVPA
jgi:EAL domain-containing protein (putative c-di-GMP-specific phosphodiesterase class I)